MAMHKYEVCAMWPCVIMKCMQWGIAKIFWFYTTMKYKQCAPGYIDYFAPVRSVCYVVLLQYEKYVVALHH